MLGMKNCCCVLTLRTGALLIACVVFAIGVVSLVTIYMNNRVEDDTVTFETAIYICYAFYTIIGPVIVYGVVTKNSISIKTAAVFVFFAYVLSVVLLLAHTLDTKRYFLIALIPVVFAINVYFGIVLWSYSKQLTEDNVE